MRRHSSRRGCLEALGHAFFTLSLGMGALITYGSYQKRGTPLFGQAVWIGGLDTGIALLACMMMFPIVFSFRTGSGFGTGDSSSSRCPLAFAEMGSGGILLGAVFFFLLTVAALTSAISLLEVAASYLIDRWNWSPPAGRHLHRRVDLRDRHPGRLQHVRRVLPRLVDPRLRHEPVRHLRLRGEQLAFFRWVVC